MPSYAEDRAEIEELQGLRRGRVPRGRKRRKFRSGAAGDLPGDRAPDPAICARDQRDFAFQPA